MTSINGSVIEINNSTDLSLKQPDCEPLVRYTVTGDGGLIQTPLQPIDEPAPDGAIYESLGVYFVSDSQREWLSKGRPSKNVQHQCRTDGRAYYRVVAESDALEVGKEATEVSQWLTEFAEDYLGIDADEYDLYFSGNRSIHLETDRWTDADGWQRLKELVRAFNRETDGNLDTAIYSTLPQWRRVGVEHRKTGLSKVPIDAEDTRSELVSKSNRGHEEHNTRVTPRLYRKRSLRESLSGEIKRGGLQILIKESSTDDRTDPDKPFSPYANAGEGQRSLILFRPFVDPCERTDGDQYAFGKVIEAIGADGNYTRSDSFCDVLLSAKDVRKWSVEPGEYVAIIGGRSRSSRLVPIDEDDLAIVTDIIDDGRREAIDALGRLGYDVGESNRIEPTDRDRPDDPNARTEAAMIQAAIEAGDREPDYDAVFRVSCRLLRLRGWRETVEWIEDVYGDGFDPARTHAHVSAILEAYPESFDVDEPDEPIDPSLASESAI